MQKVPTDRDMGEWDYRDRLRDGSRIFVRMLRSDDAALYPDFLAEVTADDMRLRSSHLCARCDASSLGS